MVTEIRQDIALGCDIRHLIKTAKLGDSANCTNLTNIGTLNKYMKLNAVTLAILGGCEMGLCHNVQETGSLEDMWGQDWPFTGIQTFAHLPHERCLLNTNLEFDVGIIGVPFDTAVSFRPGARFGPEGIRRASQRQTSMRGFNFRAGINPYQNWAKVMDCGDIPVTPMDNHLALKMMGAAYDNLLGRNSSTEKSALPPRLVSLGGDHSILLPILRSLHKVYGPVSVIHFDSHLDTWAPTKYPSYWHSEESEFTHGSMLWLAKQEGLLSESHNVHAGLRTRLSGTDWEDYDEDDEVGFHRIQCDEILSIGVDGIAQKILSFVPKDVPVYISVDIDVLDPSAAPGTGTMEVGGLLTRELISILRKLEDLNIVGADIVEVSPAYDHGDITSLAAAQVAYEIITSMVKKGPIESSIVERNKNQTSSEAPLLQDHIERPRKVLLGPHGQSLDALEAEQVVFDSQISLL